MTHSHSILEDFEDRNALSEAIEMVLSDEIDFGDATLWASLEILSVSCYRRSYFFFVIGVP